MADTKLSALAALTGANVADGDLFYVDDISVTTSKSITAAVAVQDLLFLQYISDTQAAQTLEGPISIQMRTAEALVTADAICRMALKVVSEDGATVRATLLAFADFGSGTEWNTSLRNQIFAFQDQVTSYTCILGDRLLLELGCNHAAAAVSLSVSHGDDNANDLTENQETDTTALNPYLKFYKRVTFQATLGNDIIALAGSYQSPTRTRPQPARMIGY